MKTQIGLYETFEGISDDRLQRLLVDTDSLSRRPGQLSEKAILCRMFIKERDRSRALAMQLDLLQAQYRRSS